MNIVEVKKAETTLPAEEAILKDIAENIMGGNRNGGFYRISENDYITVLLETTSRNDIVFSFSLIRSEETLKTIYIPYLEDGRALFAVLRYLMRLRSLLPQTEEM